MPLLPNDVHQARFGLLVLEKLNHILRLKFLQWLLLCRRLLILWITSSRKPGKCSLRHATASQRGSSDRTFFMTIPLDYCSGFGALMPVKLLVIRIYVTAHWAADVRVYLVHVYVGSAKQTHTHIRIQQNIRHLQQCNSVQAKLLSGLLESFNPGFSDTMMMFKVVCSE